MTAGAYDITAEQGAAFAMRATYKDSNAAAVDLTGYTARMQVRKSVASATVILELTTSNSRITLGGSAGTVDLAVTAADMAAISAGVYVYDLELVNDSAVTRLIQGAFTVSAEVTR